MANKFKQAEKKNKVAPGGGNPAPEVVETVEVTPAPPPVETPVTVGELLTGKVEKKQEGKSVSLYLTTEALENLNKFAKANNCSKSKAADLVFRNLY